MYSYVLQDWVTIRGANQTPIIQSEAFYLGFSGFQDMVFWIDMRQVTPPGAGGVVLAIETSPSKDEALGMFVSMTNAITFAAGAAVGVFTNPLGTLPKSILSTNPANALASWVRWKLTSNAAGTWDLTFRIILSANKVAKTDIPGAPSPYGCGCDGRSVPGLSGPAGFQRQAMPTARVVGR